MIAAKRHAASAGGYLHLFQVFLVFGPKPQSIESRSPPNFGFFQFIENKFIKILKMMSFKF